MVRKEVSVFPVLPDIEVIALVGPSGSGKSHRAMSLAREYECDAIVDDGLLIMGSRIVAGKSAKAEETKAAAVRRAIFASPEHALDVRNAIEKLAPKRLLVLGVSTGMVDRILLRLGLPKPLATISIESVATPEEIRDALWMRRQEGKHVIPAPSFEVKRTFSGYLVDPLSVFSRQRGKLQTQERSVVRPTYSYFGSYSIADQVVMQIASRICAEVDGVARVMRVVVLPMGDASSIETEVAVKFGFNAFEVMKNVQLALKEKLEFMTGIYLKGIDVYVKKVIVD